MVPAGPSFVFAVTPSTPPSLSGSPRATPTILLIPPRSARVDPLVEDVPKAPPSFFTSSPSPSPCSSSTLPAADSHKAVPVRTSGPLQPFLPLCALVLPRLARPSSLCPDRTILPFLFLCSSLATCTSFSVFTQLASTPSLHDRFHRSTPFALFRRSAIALHPRSATALRYIARPHHLAFALPRCAVSTCRFKLPWRNTPRGRPAFFALQHTATCSVSSLGSFALFHCHRAPSLSNRSAVIARLLCIIA